MKDPITQIGGENHPFPSTHWSCIAGDPSDSPQQRGERLGAFLQSYWKPIYWHVRHAWGKPNEDAKDLTQDFLRHLIEADVLGRASPAKGSLRAYVKTALRHFLTRAEQHTRRQKRGGDVRIIPLDGPDNPDPPAAKTPDEAFDREWAQCVLAQALAAVEQHLRDSSKEKVYEAFRMQVVHPPPEGISYRETAARLGVSEGDIKNYVFECRNLLRQALRRVVAGQVPHPQEEDDELRALFGDNA
ncbi:MAG: sigma-70 family RNA polymerase sigma factor [Planctomycetes bacterium]|nr:sigma-70 family RNA polymerase sigma factor [Planctomycetota bacterium]